MALVISLFLISSASPVSDASLTFTSLPWDGVGRRQGGRGERERKWGTPLERDGHICSIIIASTWMRMPSTGKVLPYLNSAISPTTRSA